MARKKISRLPAAASVTDDDLVPIVTGGITSSATVAQIRDGAGGGGTTPTGDGFYHVTGGVMDAAAVAVNLATADVTGVLPVANGGFTAPTGTGMVTVTSAVIDAASKPVAAGFYTFAATPSSANLATLVTDETGTGALVFATAPLFKTSINLNNPADTFKYVIVGSNLGADKTATLPLLVSDDTFAFAAHSQTLSNKTLDAPLITSGAYTFANPAGTFSYTIQAAAIAAARTLTLPLLAGNDTMVCEAFTQTLTNKTINGANNTLTVRIASDVSGLGTNVATFLGTPSGANLGSALTSALAANKVVQATGTGIPHVVAGVLSAASSLIVNADVDAAAGIAGTKISPNFGAQDILGTTVIRIGTTFGTADCHFFNTPTAAGSVCFGVGPSTADMAIRPTCVEFGKPLVGGSGLGFVGATPFRYSVAVIATTTLVGNYTASGAEYACPIIQHTSSAGSGNKNIELPNSLGATYLIDNQSASTTATFLVAGQTGVLVGVSKKATIYCNGTDYVRVTPDT